MSVIEDLAALQEQDAVVRDLEQQVRDIPLRKAQELERIQVERDAVVRARAALDDLNALLKKDEEEIASLREQLKNRQIEKLSLRTNREFSEVNEMIEKIKERIRAAEDATLAREEQKPPLEEALRDAEERLAEAKAEVDGYLADLDQLLSEAEAQLAEARAAREELAKPLHTPAALRYLTVYERLSKSRWPALVKVENRVCQGCHMELPASKVQDIARGTMIVTCEYCGRLVYC